MIARRLLSAALLACLALPALPARSQTVPDSALETIKKRGTMMVGMATFVPWAMRDTQGNLIGFEIDVANKLAADMGVKLELVPTAWDGIIPALLAGKFDVIIGGMTITPKRNLTVNFSAPYDYAGTSLAVVPSMKDGFKLDALNSARVTLTCRRGSSACTNLAEYFPKATLRQFDDDAALTQEVLNGNAQGFGASEPLPSRMAAENPGKLFTPLSQDQELNRLPAGMAVRKGDVDTLNFLEQLDRGEHQILPAEAALLVRDAGLARPSEDELKPDGRTPPSAPAACGVRLGAAAGCGGDRGGARRGWPLLAIRANTVLGYRWDWSVISTFLVRTDPASGRWAPNLLLTGLFTTLRLAVWSLAAGAC